MIEVKIDQEAYDELKDTDWNYQDVANEVGIEPAKFDELMVERFDESRGKEGKDYHLSYTLEWAARVKRDAHFRAADKETTKVLEQAGYER